MAEPEALKRFFVGESFTGCLVARLPKSPLGGVGNEIGREGAGVVIAVFRGDTLDFEKPSDEIGWAATTESVCGRRLIFTEGSV